MTLPRRIPRCFTIPATLACMLAADAQAGETSTEKKEGAAQTTTQTTAVTEGTTEGTELPLVVVTATRQEEPLLNAPVSSSVVTAEQLDERQVATLPDALREVPGVMVQKTSVGQGS